MKTKLLGVVAALVLLGVSQAGATTTYVYTGSGPLSTSFSCTVPSMCPTSPSTLPGMSASIVFNSNTTNTSGIFDLSSVSTATLSAPFFAVTYPPWPLLHLSVTLASGLITAWDLSTMVPGPNGMSMQTSTAGDFLQINNWSQGVSMLATAGPGTWSGPITPVPGALPLFVTGLGLFGLLGWRRKRKAAA